MSTPLRTHNFTVDEYHLMGEVGVFHENDRVELIDGQVVEMTPIGPRHARCVDDLTRLLSRSREEGAGRRETVDASLITARHHAPCAALACSAEDR